MKFLLDGILESSQEVYCKKQRYINAIVIYL